MCLVQHYLQVQIEEEKEVEGSILDKEVGQRSEDRKRQTSFGSMGVLRSKTTLSLYQCLSLLTTTLIS